MATEQMRLENVRPEFLVPEAKPFFMSLTGAMSIRLRMVDEYQRRGYREVTRLDGGILFHCFIWSIVGGDGTRQGEILDQFHYTPRATIRSALGRLVRIELLTRTDRTLPGKPQAIFYHPATAVGDVCNQYFEANMVIHEQMADAFGAYRARLGR